MSVSPSTLECRINYCWTKLCLFLDVRIEDHWSRSSCTRKSWRISVPAAKQCSPELDSPVVSSSVRSVRNLQCCRKNLIVTIAYRENLIVTIIGMLLMVSCTSTHSNLMYFARFWAVNPQNSQRKYTTKSYTRFANHSLYYLWFR